MKTLFSFKLSVIQAGTLRGGTEEAGRTKVNEMYRETYVNKAKMADKAMNAITQYISS
ncbi:hypothetical protein AB9P05_21765 [Roseivirga sp. BDSF3-8]|uniref:hypothetical protein n=1 Tax=Roseivirga sp. BDSF3-8 TaxID=3241598 RepID=UPI0035327339